MSLTPLKLALTLTRNRSEARRGSPGLFAKTVDGRLRVREIGQMRFDILQSGEILLVSLGSQRPLREFQLPI